MKFEVDNVNCEKCATTIKNSLEDEFGNIEVDLSATPRIVSCDLKEDMVDKFKQELNELGFKVLKELR